MRRCALVWRGGSLLVLFLVYLKIAYELDNRTPLGSLHRARLPCSGPLQANSSGLKVINAGLSKTGTTSMSEALIRLGMRTYRCPDHVQYLHSVLDKRVREEHRSLDPAVVHGWANEMASHLARCRVDAVTLEPFNHWLPELLQGSPGAKVVLTVRDFAQWQRSSEMFVGRWAYFYVGVRLAFSGAKLLPWARLLQLLSAGALMRHMEEGGPELVRAPTSWSGVFLYYSQNIWDFEQFRILTVMESLGGLTWPANAARIFHFFAARQEDERIFEQWHRFVQELVPKGQLLLFDVQKHGWRELGDFLGLPVPDEPFPHSQSVAQSLFPSAPAQNNQEAFLGALAAGMGIHLVNFSALWCLARRVRALLPRRAAAGKVE